MTELQLGLLIVGSMFYVVGVVFTPQILDNGAEFFEDSEIFVITILWPFFAVFAFGKGICLLLKRLRDDYE